MSIDETLNAALGYMLPEGSSVEDVVVDLFERVQREAQQIAAPIVKWQGEEALAEGFGDIVIALERVGAWERWEICRRDIKGKVHCIMGWESIEVDYVSGSD